MLFCCICVLFFFYLANNKERTVCWQWCTHVLHYSVLIVAATLLATVYLNIFSLFNSDSTVKHCYIWGKSNRRNVYTVCYLPEAHLQPLCRFMLLKLPIIMFLKSAKSVHNITVLSKFSCSYYYKTMSAGLTMLHKSITQWSFKRVLTAVP